MMTKPSSNTDYDPEEHAQRINDAYYTAYRIEDQMPTYEAVTGELENDEDYPEELLAQIGLIARTMADNDSRKRDAVKLLHLTRHLADQYHKAREQTHRTMRSHNRMFNELRAHKRAQTFALKHASPKIIRLNELWDKEAEQNQADMTET